jgi:hypothetical protein
MPPWQHGSPSCPHTPAWQPPFLHVPWPFEQLPAFATHTFALLSQHPPALHVLPSQQG